MSFLAAAKASTFADDFRTEGLDEALWTFTGTKPSVYPVGAGVNVQGVHIPASSSISNYPPADAQKRLDFWDSEVVFVVQKWAPATCDLYVTQGASTSQYLYGFQYVTGTMSLRVIKAGVLHTISLGSGWTMRYLRIAHNATTSRVEFYAGNALDGSDARRVTPSSWTTQTVAPGSSNFLDDMTVTIARNATAGSALVIGSVNAPGRTIDRAAGVRGGYLVRDFTTWQSNRPNQFNSTTVDAMSHEWKNLTASGNISVNSAGLTARAMSINGAEAGAGSPTRSSIRSGLATKIKNVDISATFALVSSLTNQGYFGMFWRSNAAATQRYQLNVYSDQCKLVVMNSPSENATTVEPSATLGTLNIETSVGVEYKWRVNHYGDQITVYRDDVELMSVTDLISYVSTPGHVGLDVFSDDSTDDSGANKIQANVSKIEVVPSYDIIGGATGIMLQDRALGIHLVNGGVDDDAVTVLDDPNIVTTLEEDLDTKFSLVHHHTDYSTTLDADVIAAAQVMGSQGRENLIVWNGLNDLTRIAAGQMDAELAAMVSAINTINGTVYLAPLPYGNLSSAWSPLQYSSATASTGVIGSSTTTSLTADLGDVWEENKWINNEVRWFSSSGDLVSATVLRNTKSTIYFTTPVATAPPSGGTYFVPSQGHNLFSGIQSGHETTLVNLMPTTDSGDNETPGPLPTLVAIDQSDNEGIGGVTNLLSDYQSDSEIVSTTYWTAGAGSAVAKSTTMAYNGTGSLRIHRPTGSGSATAITWNGTVNMTAVVAAGQTIDMSAQVRAGSVGRAGSLIATFQNASSVQVGLPITFATFTDRPDAWTEVRGTTIVPATATKMSITIRYADVPQLEYHYADWMHCYVLPAPSWLVLTPANTSIFRTSVHSYTNTYSVSVKALSAGAAMTWRPSPAYGTLVTAGTTIKVSGWFRSNTVNAPVGCLLYFQDAGSTPVGSPLAAFTVTPSTTGWTYAVGSVVVPATATKVAVSFSRTAVLAGEQFWMDTFDVSEVANPYWTNVANAEVTRSDASAQTGSWSTRMRSTGSTSMTMAFPGPVTGSGTITPGLPYEFVGYTKADSVGRQVTLTLNWYTSGDVVIGSSIQLSQLTNTTSGWTRMVGSAVAPATAAKYKLTVSVVTSVVSEAHYFDTFSVENVVTTNWESNTGGGNEDVQRSSAASLDGTHSLRVASGARMTGNGVSGVVAGDVVTLSAWTKAAISGEPITLGATFHNDAGVQQGGVLNAITASNTTGWTQLTGTVIAPVGATRIKPFVMIDPTGVSTTIHYFDRISANVNIGWKGNTTALYRTAFQYITNYFRTAGSRARMVFSLNWISDYGTSYQSEAEDMYPGDSYVDNMLIRAINLGVTDSSLDEWRSVNQMLTGREGEGVYDQMTSVAHASKRIFLLAGCAETHFRFNDMESGHANTVITEINSESDHADPFDEVFTTSSSNSPIYDGLIVGESSGGREWVGEKAFSTSNPAQARTIHTVAAVDGHDGFPGIAKLTDGRLMAVWRRGVSHVGTNGSILAAYSSDNGVTWTEGTAVYVDLTVDQRDPSLAVLSNGNVVLSWFESGGSVGSRSYIMVSTDNGATWSNRFRLAGSINSSPVVEMPDGRLLLATYGLDANIWHSFDGGLTWANANQDRNLMLNPSFSDTSTLLTANQAGAEVANEWVNVTNATVTRDGAQFRTGAWSTKAVAIAAGTMSMTTSPAYGLATVAGQRYEFSAWVRPGTTLRTVTLRVTFRDGALTPFGAVVAGSVVEVAGAWTKVTGTWVAPTNAVTMKVDVEWAGCALGEAHYLDDAELYRTDMASIYGWNTLWPADTLVTRTQAWSSVGIHSLRVKALTAVNGQAGTVNTSIKLPNVVAGQEYTVSCRAKTVTGTQNAYLVVQFYDAMNGLVGSPFQSSTFGLTTTESGMHRTATAPAGATQAVVYFYMSSPTLNQEVYLDGFMFVKGSVTSPTYYDGSSWNAGIWEGESHKSQSIKLGDVIASAATIDNFGDLPVEPYLMYDPSTSSVVAMIRTSGDQIVVRSVSTDNGVTWGPSQKHITWVSNSRIQTIMTDGGVAYAFYRDAGSFSKLMMRSSVDGFATFSTAGTQIADLDYRNTYAAMVEISPNTIGIIYGQESSTFLASNLYFQVPITDGEPFGPRTYTSWTLPTSDIKRVSTSAYFLFDGGIGPGLSDMSAEVIQLRKEDKIVASVKVESVTGNIWVESHKGQLIYPMYEVPLISNTWYRVELDIDFSLTDPTNQRVDLKVYVPGSTGNSPGAWSMRDTAMGNLGLIGQPTEVRIGVLPSDTLYVMDAPVYIDQMKVSTDCNTETYSKAAWIIDLLMTRGYEQITKTIFFSGIDIEDVPADDAAGNGQLAIDYRRNDIDTRLNGGKYTAGLIRDQFRSDEVIGRIHQRPQIRTAGYVDVSTTGALEYMKLVEVGYAPLVLSPRIGGILLRDYDLGGPAVRSAIEVRTADDGSLDYSRFVGSKGVSLQFLCFEDSSGSVDFYREAVSAWANPGRRPTLIYKMKGGIEKSITLRPDSINRPWTVEGTRTSMTEMQIQFVATDGKDFSTVENTIVLPYDEIIQVGTPGTASSSPIVRFWGGTTGALNPIIISVSEESRTGAATARLGVGNASPRSVFIPDGQFVEIDMGARTVQLNGLPGPENSYMRQLSARQWFRLNPYYNDLVYQSQDGNGFATITWKDSYL